MADFSFQGPSTAAKVRNALIAAGFVGLVFAGCYLTASSMSAARYAKLSAPLQAVVVPIPAGSILLAADSVPPDPNLPGVDVRRIYLVPCTPAQLKRVLDPALEHPELRQDYDWSGFLNTTIEPARGIWRGGYANTVTDWSPYRSPEISARPDDRGMEVDVTYATGKTRAYDPKLAYLGVVDAELRQRGVLSGGAIQDGWGVLLVRVAGDAISTARFADGGQAIPTSRATPYLQY